MKDNTAALPDTGGGQAEKAAVVEHNLSSLRSMVAQLRALPRPLGEEQTIDLIVGKLDKLLAEGPKVLETLRLNDESVSTQLSLQVEAEAEAANDALATYGMTDCGSPHPED
jgi:hypothetical protein